MPLLCRGVCVHTTGAETGVELADILSNRLGLASNGEDLSLCRRNKHLMGEQVRACWLCVCCVCV